MSVKKKFQQILNHANGITWNLKYNKIYTNSCQGMLLSVIVERWRDATLEVFEKS